jgi:hypothetical protein
MKMSHLSRLLKMATTTHCPLRDGHGAGRWRRYRDSLATGAGVSKPSNSLIRRSSSAISLSREVFVTAGPVEISQPLVEAF